MDVFSRKKVFFNAIFNGKKVGRAKNFFLGNLIFYSNKIDVQR